MTASVSGSLACGGRQGCQSSEVRGQTGDTVMTSACCQECTHRASRGGRVPGSQCQRFAEKVPNAPSVTASDHSDQFVKLKVTGIQLKVTGKVSEVSRDANLLHPPVLWAADWASRWARYNEVQTPSNHESKSKASFGPLSMSTRKITITRQTLARHILPIQTLATLIDSVHATLLMSGTFISYS